jgi:hypothetical protein
MKSLMIFVAAALLSTTAMAAGTRTLDGQQITNGAAILTLPSGSSDTLVGRATTDTLTNKTLTSPAITTPTGIVKGDVGLGNVDNTSDVNKPVSSATTTALGLKVNTSAVGASSGVASLDSGGKIPLGQLPASLMEYQGTYNASTNTPTLVDGTGTSGYFYRVNTAGTQNFGSGSQTFVVGDWVMYNGAIWQLAHAGADAVVTVNGSAGVVTVNAINQLTGDVTAGPASGSASAAGTVVKVNGGSIPVSKTIVGTNGSGQVIDASSATLANNTTGTAANITGTSNSTITTLSSLSLPGAQVTGNISGNAANISATSNSTLTTLSSLSLPGTQVSGNISGNAANVTGTVGPGNGGLGVANPTANGILVGQGSSNVSSVTCSNSGYVLSWSGSAWACIAPPSSSPSLNGGSGSPESVTAGGGISLSAVVSSNLVWVAGSGGAVIVTKTPSVTAGTADGQKLNIVGTSATNTVTLQDQANLASSGLSLNGNWVGGKDSNLSLHWDATQSLWVEDSRR